MPDALTSPWRKAWRDLARHRARTLLVALAVALALAGAGAVLDTWALVQRATVQGYAASLPVSATLSADGSIDAAVPAEVRELPGVGAARLRRSLVLNVETAGRWNTAVLYSFDDFGASGIGLLKPEGHWPPGDGDLVIERSSLDFSGAAVGDALALKPRRGDPVSLRVASVVRDVSLAPGWMEHVVYGYVSPATMQRLGMPAGFDELQIRAADAHPDRSAVRRLAAAAQATLERRGVRVNAVEVPEPGEHVHAAQMNSLLMTQAAFGLLGLLVCAFLVVNLMQSVLAGQAREIGVMKTLGASPSQIARLYLAQAALLGLLASLVALPAALAIGQRYAAFKIEMLNFPAEGLAVPGWVLALQLLVGLALPVLAAALPVRRACRMPVSAALRDIGIVAAGGALASPRRVAVGGLARPLLLALGNAFRKRQRMALTLLALAAGSAVYLGAANLRGAVQASTDLLFAAQHFDFSLRLLEPQPVARLEAAAAAVPGLAYAEAWRSHRATLADSSEGVSIVAVPDGSRALQPRLIEGHWPSPDDSDAIVLSRSLMRQQAQLRVGDPLPLRIDGRQRAWKVVGMVDAGPQAVAYTRRAQLDALLGDSLATALVVALPPGTGTATQLAAIASLRGALAEAGMPVSSSQRVQEGRRVYEDHLLMVVDFLGGMGLLMLAVGALGLASTMGLAVLERRREIGVLRAIGARDAAVMLLVQAEGLVITALAWLASLPLAVPMSVLLAEAFGRVMFPLPTPWWPDPAAAARWLLVMLPISLAACAWPAWRAARIPVAGALAYE